MELRYVERPWSFDAANFSTQQKTCQERPGLINGIKKDAIDLKISCNMSYLLLPVNLSVMSFSLFKTYQITFAMAAVK